MAKFRNSMRVLAVTAASAALAISATPALATKPVNPPTEHGFCALGSTCVDNGTNTPTDVNPPVFGFASSGQGTTGDLILDILLPNNLPPPSSFTVSGGNPDTSGTFTLVGDWTSGTLASFLGISASPTNPIGAYLPTTLNYQPSATGFWVFQVDLGTQNLLGTSGVGGVNNDNYLLTLGQDLAAGSYIVAFLQQNGQYGATANSGAILETGGVPEPATWAMMLLGFGAVGVGMRRNRRKAKLVSQLA
jgi:hypothetical protein